MIFSLITRLKCLLTPNFFAKIGVIPNIKHVKKLDDLDISSSKYSVRAVLGIDAAWTLRNPSGVALAVNGGDGWRLIAVSPSYDHFNARAHCGSPPVRALRGSKPCAAEIITSCEKICGYHVDLVAVDMPLSIEPITGRRTSDDKVSAAYSKKKCGAASPTAFLPGLVSDNLRREFQQAGYPLLTTTVVPPGLIEVYPHPALVELFGARERLPYKLAKQQVYWPNSTPDERGARLRCKWSEIIARLDAKIAGVSEALVAPPANAPADVLKAYEDMIDAVVCAWVAICALEGKAAPFGDEKSAIWIPNADLPALAPTPQNRL